MSTITKLAVLGVLFEKDMHGYEIKKHIEERMGDYTDVKFGSIYYFLNSFLEDGHIRELVSTAEKEKRVYSITDKGKEYFHTLASAALTMPYQHIDPIGVLLNFIYVFPRKTIIEAFTNRLSDLEQLKSKALRERSRLMAIPEVPKLANFLFTHTLHHVNTEIEWTEDFISFIAADRELIRD